MCYVEFSYCHSEKTSLVTLFRNTKLWGIFEIHKLSVSFALLIYIGRFCGVIKHRTMPKAAYSPSTPMPSAALGRVAMTFVYSVEKA